MKKYPTYKPSGVEWIGDVPEHWEVKKLKLLADVFGGTTPESGNDEFWDGDVFWVTPEDLGKLNGAFIQDTKRKITQKGVNSCRLRIAPSNSLIISGRAPIGHLGILKMPACTNQGCKTMFFNESGICLYYYFLMLLSKEDLNSIGKGTTFLELSTQNLKDYQVLSPPLPEQTAIAAYLDRKTAQIDQTIAEKEKLIELFREERQALINHAVTKGIRPGVKMKDSGVGWIGEVPEGWEVLSMKYLCKFILDGTHGTFERVDQGYRLLSVRNIIGNKFQFRDDDSRVSEKDFQTISSRFLIQKDDIQLAIVGATLGKVALVEEMEEEFVTQRSLATIRTNKGVCLANFLYFFISSSFFQSFLWQSTGFSAQPGIYLGTLQNAKIPLPPISEQNSIVDYIIEKTTQIDTAISGIQQEIALLQEYRQALIFEAVTGKIDVREYAQN